MLLFTILSCHLIYTTKKQEDGIKCDDCNVNKIDLYNTEYTKSVYNELEIFLNELIEEVPSFRNEKYLRY